MELAAGICPKCHEYLLLKSNVPFLVCPQCGEKISNQIATTTLDARCADPKETNNLIGECIALEIQYGAALPYLILAKIVDNFPRLESPAYLLVKMSGFTNDMVYWYLKNFANVNSEPDNVPWAKEFLDTCLDQQHIAMAELFTNYVYHKLAKADQDKYLEIIASLKKDYTAKASPRSTKWLLALYIGASVLNVLSLPGLMLLSGWLAQFFWMYYAVNIAIVMVLVCAEMLLLFWHHHVFGNRLDMSATERLWFVVFMCSLVVAIGAIFVGSIWKIKL